MTERLRALAWETEMKRSVRTVCIAAAPCAAIAAAWGCNAIVDSGGYHVVPPDGATPGVDGNLPDAPADAPGVDAPPPPVDGCVPGTNRQTLENQCGIAAQCQST